MNTPASVVKFVASMMLEKMSSYFASELAVSNEDAISRLQSVSENLIDDELSHVEMMNVVIAGGIGVRVSLRSLRKQTFKMTCTGHHVLGDFVTFDVSFFGTIYDFTCVAVHDPVQSLQVLQRLLKDVADAVSPWRMFKVVSRRDTSTMNWITDHVEISKEEFDRCVPV